MSIEQALAWRLSTGKMENFKNKPDTVALNAAETHLRIRYSRRIEADIGLVDRLPVDTVPRFPPFGMDRKPGKLQG
jgi:hypothetical protein